MGCQNVMDIYHNKLEWMIFSHFDDLLCAGWAILERLTSQKEQPLDGTSGKEREFEKHFMEKSKGWQVTDWNFID